MNQDLDVIFLKLKKLMKKYEGKFTPKVDRAERYDLWSIKDVQIAGRKRDEVYFGGLIIQSDYVGFYFMPIYADPNLKEVFGQDLMKLKKGKSCFHIRELNTELEKQIATAIKIGYEMYKKRGWV